MMGKDFPTNREILRTIYTTYSTYYLFISLPETNREFLGSESVICIQCLYDYDAHWSIRLFLFRLLWCEIFLARENLIADAAIVKSAVISLAMLDDSVLSVYFIKICINWYLLTVYCFLFDGAHIWLISKYILFN